MTYNKSFFRKNDRVNDQAKKIKKAEKEFITWGAAWMYSHKDEQPLPYFSIRIDKEGLKQINNYAESSEDGSINMMMFANYNQREGHVDPDYYLVPTRDYTKNN